jgi:response regulator NasT
MKRRVLVVDDHPPSVKFLREALNRLGYDIAGEEASGKRVVELVKNTTPDVVLMAVGLPDIDGISAAAKVMEESPRPVVLLTSHHDSNTIHRAKAAGVMGFLVKPLREEELLPALEVSISRYGEFTALRRENQDLKETIEARKAIERAKGIIMDRYGLREPEAFSMIQKKSMDSRKPMVEIANAIILTEEMSRSKAP